MSLLDEVATETVNPDALKTFKNETNGSVTLNNN